MKLYPCNTRSRLAVLMVVFAVGTLQPVQALAYGEDCKIPGYFECLYNAAVDYYENEVIPYWRGVKASLEREIDHLESQLKAPKDIAENLANTITRSDLGFLGLDRQSMDRYTEALEFVRNQNDKLSGEFEYFAGDPDCSASPVCARFRSRLADTLYLVTDVTDEANRMVALQHELDGEPPLPPLLLNSEGLGDFVSRAPPALLFPLYYMLNTAPASSGKSTQATAVRSTMKSDDCVDAFCPFFDQLESMLFRVLADLTDMDSQLQYAKMSLDAFGPPRDPLCTTLFLQPSVPDEINQYASITSVSAQVIAELGGWLGKPKLTLLPYRVGAAVSFGAEMAVEWNVDLGKRFGIHLRRLATPLKLIGEGLSSRISDCRQRLEQYLVICSINNDIKKNDTFHQCKQEILFTNHDYGF